MQITFDPLNAEESAAVAVFIAARYDIQPQTAPSTRDVLRPDGSVRHRVGSDNLSDEDRSDMSTQLREFVESPAAVRAEVAATIAQADQPDTGADAPSAAPLEQPAPLPAAADLFGTAPVAPPAGEPSAPIVPPPPVPSAPPAAAPSANALPVIPAGDVDKHGLPWDDRIHSGTRVKNADGSWRQRRGVDADLVKTVENELRALMAIPTRPGVTLGSAGPLEVTTDAPTTSAIAPPVTHGASTAAGISPPPPPITVAASSPSVVAEPGNVPPPPVPAPPTSAPATAPIPTPPVPPAPTAAEPTVPLTFATMLRKVTDALAQNKIKETDVHAALEKIGLLPTQIGLLSARADLLPAFDTHIAAAIGAGHA